MDFVAIVMERTGLCVVVGPNKANWLLFMVTIGGGDVGTVLVDVCGWVGGCVCMCVGGNVV